MLQGVHDYGLAELATALGKSDASISALLSLNKLPAEVKDDCRNDQKTVWGILVELAKRKTPEKILALYTCYKESGLTRGEIRKKVVTKSVKITTGGNGCCCLGRET